MPHCIPHPPFLLPRGVSENDVFPMVVLVGKLMTKQVPKPFSIIPKYPINPYSYYQWKWYHGKIKKASVPHLIPLNHINSPWKSIKKKRFFHFFPLCFFRPNPSHQELQCHNKESHHARPGPWAMRKIRGENSYEMIWNEMLWNEMIWTEMKWYELKWTGMNWYEMIWYDMIQYDMIWYDVINVEVYVPPR